MAMIRKECIKTFENKTSLDFHTKITHGINARYDCNFCDQKFKTNDELQRHLILHDNNIVMVQFQCSICYKVFKKKGFLLKHMNHCHDCQSESTPSKYQCDVCKKKFKHESKLVKHQRSHITDPKSSIENMCKKCGQEFLHKYDLDCHEKTHNDYVEVNGVFACKKCDKSFRLESSVRKHMKCHTSQQSSDTFKCVECDKTFLNRRNLINHMRLHKGDKFECEVCETEFKWKSCLVNHMKLHKDEHNPKSRLFAKKKFVKCALCDLSTSQKILMKHYTSVHHLNLCYKELTFASKKDVEEWINDVESEPESLTHFILKHQYKTKTCQKIHYMCHRSGVSITKLNEDNRKRMLKKSGYKQVNGLCPAEIKLDVFEDGTCKVRYQSVHVNHEDHTGMAEKESIHIYMKKEDRERIVEKISLGYTAKEIQKEFMSDMKDKSSLKHLNSKQLRNIAVQNGLQLKNIEQNITKKQDYDDNLDYDICSVDVIEDEDEMVSESEFEYVDVSIEDSIQYASNNVALEQEKLISEGSLNYNTDNREECVYKYLFSEDYSERVKSISEQVQYDTIAIVNENT